MWSARALASRSSMSASAALKPGRKTLSPKEGFAPPRLRRSQSQPAGGKSLSSPLPTPKPPQPKLWRLSHSSSEHIPSFHHPSSEQLLNTPAGGKKPARARPDPSGRARARNCPSSPKPNFAVPPKSRVGEGREGATQTANRKPNPTIQTNPPERKARPNSHRPKLRTAPKHFRRRQEASPEQAPIRRGARGHKNCPPSPAPRSK
jgi:hypothetical protein